MANIPMYDPLSSEARSPLIAGLTEACNKLSSSLKLETKQATNMQLVPIYVSDEDKYRIYQAPLGTKLWLNSPSPIIKKNGSVITPSVDEFTIDYVGGSIAFENNKQLTESDTVTVDVTYFTGDSQTIEDFTDAINSLSLDVAHFKGYFNDYTSMNSTLKTGVSGDFAVVGGSENNLFIWNDTTNQWEPVYRPTDLNNYYTKKETEDFLIQKEDVIDAYGVSDSDDNYYYGGRKSWQNVNEKVLETKFPGLDNTNTKEVTSSDNVLSAIGKLQGQTNAIKRDKADKIVPSVVGNIATLDANGNLMDSGKGVDYVGKIPATETIILLYSDWTIDNETYTQTVSVNGVISDKNKQIIISAPTPDDPNEDMIGEFEVKCIEQGDNTLTYRAKGLPTEDLKFNIILMNL